MLFLSDLHAFLDVFVVLLVEKRDVDNRVVIHQLLFCKSGRVYRQEREVFDFVPVGVLAVIAPGSIDDGASVSEHDLDLDIRLHLRLVVNRLLVREGSVLATVFNVAWVVLVTVAERLACAAVIFLVLVLLSFQEVLHAVEEFPPERHVLALDYMHVDRSLFEVFVPDCHSLLDQRLESATALKQPRENGLKRVLQVQVHLLDYTLIVDVSSAALGVECSLPVFDLV